MHIVHKGALGRAWRIKAFFGHDPTGWLEGYKRHIRGKIQVVGKPLAAALRDPKREDGDMTQKMMRRSLAVGLATVLLSSTGCAGQDAPAPKETGTVLSQEPGAPAGMLRPEQEEDPGTPASTVPAQEEDPGASAGTVPAQEEDPGASAGTAPSAQEEDMDGGSDTRTVEDIGNGMYRVCAYNDNGDLVREEIHHPDGSLFSSTAYSYDADGDLTSTECYTYEGSSRYDRVVTSHDPDGTSRSEHYDQEEGPMYLSREFDANGQQIRETYYDDKGSVSYCSIYRYDDEGNMIYEEDRSADGSYEIYIYDSDQQLIKKEQHGVDGG